MAHPLRIDLGNYVFHVINHANGWLRIFANDATYRDFEYESFLGDEV